MVSGNDLELVAVFEEHWFLPQQRARTWTFPESVL